MGNIISGIDRRATHGSMGLSGRRGGGTRGGGGFLRVAKNRPVTVVSRVSALGTVIGDMNRRLCGRSLLGRGGPLIIVCTSRGGNFECVSSLCCYVYSPSGPCCGGGVTRLRTICVLCYSSVSCNLIHTL